MKFPSNFDVKFFWTWNDCDSDTWDFGVKRQECLFSHWNHPPFPLQQADRCRVPATFAAAAAANGSTSRQLHAEQSWSTSQCGVNNPWAEQHLYSTSYYGFTARRACNKVCYMLWFPSLEMKLWLSKCVSIFAYIYAWGLSGQL